MEKSRAKGGAEQIEGGAESIKIRHIAVKPSVFSSRVISRLIRTPLIPVMLHHVAVETGCLSQKKVINDAHLHQTTNYTNVLKIKLIQRQ